MRVFANTFYLNEMSLASEISARDVIDSERKRKPHGELHHRPEEKGKNPLVGGSAHSDGNLCSRFYLARRNRRTGRDGYPNEENSFPSICCDGYGSHGVLGVGGAASFLHDNAQGRGRAPEPPDMGVPADHVRDGGHGFGFRLGPLLRFATRFLEAFSFYLRHQLLLHRLIRLSASSCTKDVRQEVEGVFYNCFL